MTTDPACGPTGPHSPYLYSIMYILRKAVGTKTATKTAT